MWTALLSAIGSYVVARLKEPTTWRGIIALLTAAGIHIAPQWQEAILTTGLGIIGAIGVTAPDPPKPSPR